MTIVAYENEAVHPAIARHASNLRRRAAVAARSLGVARRHACPRLTTSAVHWQIRPRTGQGTVGGRPAIRREPARTPANLKEK